MVLIGIAWFYCGYLMHKTTKSDVQEQINGVWINSIQTDCHNRLAETGSKYIRQYNKNTSLSPSNITIETDNEEKHWAKDEIPHPKNEKDIENRAIQTYLLYKHPIQLMRLDSLFQTLLKERNITAPTAVAYLHNENGNHPEYSVLDTTFCSKSFATQKIQTGIDNSIILRGYVKLSVWDYIQHSPLFYLLWISCGILLFFFICHYKKKVLSTANKRILSQKEKTYTEIRYLSNEKILTDGRTTLSLTPMQGILLNCLMENEKYYQPHETIIKRLWPYGEGDKKKLEQQKRFLQNKLKDMPALSIKITRGVGYTLLIKEGYTLTYVK